jgi:hypothetical protein
VELWELVAREEIREVIFRYNLAGDRGRIDDFVSIFTEDGVLELVGASVTSGRAAISQVLGRQLRHIAEESGAGPVRHLVTNLLIHEVTQTSARTSAYFLVLARIGVDHWGRYQDSLRHSGGGWRIAHRRIWVDGTGPNGTLYPLGPTSPNN